MNKYNIPQVPFYFIRHGQTDWNLKHLIQGHTDIPLNKTGIAQAQDASEHLIEKNITRIVTSPLIRAYRTAAIINKTLQVPLLSHDGLKERFLGKLEGTEKTTSALSSIFTNYTQMAEDSEDVDNFKKRIAKTLHELLDPNHVTLIVAHGGVYWALMNILCFENQASLNAMPYYFNPTNDKWCVSLESTKEKSRK